MAADLAAIAHQLKLNHFYLHISPEPRAPGRYQQLLRDPHDEFLPATVNGSCLGKYFGIVGYIFIFGKPSKLAVRARSHQNWLSCGPVF